MRRQRSQWGVLGLAVMVSVTGWLEPASAEYRGEQCLDRMVFISPGLAIPPYPGLYRRAELGYALQVAHVENLTDQEVTLDLVLHYEGEYEELGSTVRSVQDKVRMPTIRLNRDETVHLVLPPKLKAESYAFYVSNELFRPLPEPASAMRLELRPKIVTSRVKCELREVTMRSAGPPAVEQANPIQEARARPYEAPARQDKVQQKTEHGAKLRGPEITSKDGMQMVLVQGGEYRRSWGTWNLSPFYMDKYEVSSKQYAQFLDETGHKKPKEFSQQLEVSNDGNRPVVNVTWKDADDYCRHVEKRLPTSQEWESAAYGPEGFSYTWGNDKPATRQVLVNRKWEGYRTLAPVGSYEDDISIYGLYDMMGNVSEWTSSDYGEEKVSRGGSWAVELRNDVGYDLNRRQASTRSTSLGFRCTKDSN